ncbi:MAG: right-handed parallel beta-helix repeat-containing protein, partial [Patescibacteria group bacterium]
MKRGGKIYKKILFFGLFIALFGLFLFLGESGIAATYTVSNTNDSGAGSLRQAITDANANPGTDTIDFSGLPTGGQETITLSSALPDITESVIIDASDNWDDTGGDDRPGVKITGSVNYGFNILDAADNTRISGIKFEGFNNNGIKLLAENTQIGMDCLGTPNNHQRNIFVGNGSGGFNDGGIYMLGADDNNIAGNWFGIDDDGETISRNNLQGLEIELSHGNVIGYEDSDEAAFSCTSAQARNIFAPEEDYSMMIRSTHVSSEVNKISGNYFNILPDGTEIIEHVKEENANHVGIGIYLWGDSENTIIGTDGDGKDDDKEGNVFAGYQSGGVYCFINPGNPTETKNNRISGNIFGGDPTGTSDIYEGPGAENGIRLTRKPEKYIIGYCDDDDDSKLGNNDLCSDGGQSDPDAQANYFIGMDNTEDDFGIRIVNIEGGGDNYIYGNYFGVGKDNSAIPLTSGMSLGVSDGLDEDEYIHIGDSGNRANVFKYNTYGIWLNYIYNYAYISGNRKIKYNIISDNTSHGIYFNNGKFNRVQTEQTGIFIENNTIVDNSGSGIYLEGSSASITSNTIEDNDEYGIYAFSKYNDITNLGAVSPYGKQTYLGIDEDLIANPIIGDEGEENSISGNNSGGIYLLESKPENESTLLTDNNIGNNNNNFDVKSDWYGAVEILDKDLDPVSSGSHTITLTPQTGNSLAGLAVDNGEFEANASDVAWGPSNFDLDDQTTWFQITDYIYDKDGNRTSYSPYTVNVSGDHANDSLSPTFSFDGLDNETNAGGIASYFQTGDIYRYQIADAVVSSVPNKPANVSPANGAMGQLKSVTLTSSAFSDVAETHSASVWNVYGDESTCLEDDDGDVYSVELTDLTAHTVPSRNLLKGETYWWSVTYKNSYGNYSDPSNCTSFSILSNNISLNASIPDQSMNEDSSLEDAFDLDDYFTNAADLDMTYTSGELENISVVIDADNKVNFTPEENWHGEETLLFTANDAEGDRLDSNSVTITVDSVNDDPNKITAGFSPKDEAVTSSRKPTLSWKATNDADHSKSELTYQVRLGKNKNPESEYKYSYTSKIGVAQVRVSDQLEDETDYYWVVRAVDPEGDKSEWSAIKQFYVNTAYEP